MGDLLRRTLATSLLAKLDFSTAQSEPAYDARYGWYYWQETFDKNKPLHGENVYCILMQYLTNRRHSSGSFRAYYTTREQAIDALHLAVGQARKNVADYVASIARLKQRLKDQFEDHKESKGQSTCDTQSS